MLDFMTVSTSRSNKSSTVEVFPKFIMKKSKDLMVRGKDFYAIWDEDRKIWSTDEDDVVRLVDNELRKYVNENADHLEGSPVIKFMWDGDSGSIDKFHKYCQKQMRDSFTMLDEELIFSNTELCREASWRRKKLMLLCRTIIGLMLVWITLAFLFLFRIIVCCIVKLNAPPTLMP